MFVIKFLRYYFVQSAYSNENKTLLFNKTLQMFSQFLFLAVFFKYNF